MTPLAQVAYLLIHVIFDTYISVLLIRFLLQKVGASWRNPISQLIIQITEKPLIFFRKLAPGYHGFDLAILLFAVILELVKSVLWLLIIGASLNPIGILCIVISNLIAKFVYIYIYAIIINAVLSWIPQLQSHPVGHIVFVITEPVLLRFRQLIPLVAGIDFSPMIALLALTIINILITQPIYHYGMTFILGGVR